jgi:hypothetical protein
MYVTEKEKFKMAKQKVELHFLYRKYSWEKEGKLFVTNLEPETFVSPDCMLVTSRTAMLDMPEIPSETASTMHRIQQMEAQLKKMRAAHYREDQELTAQIQELRCLSFHATTEETE